MIELLSLIAIVFVAGILQGMTGFGVVLIALPLLGLFMPIKTIIPLLILLALCINVFLSYQLRKSIQFRNITLLFLANLPGIPLGVYILKHFPAQVLSLCVGGVMISFTAYLLLVKPTPRNLGKGWTIFAGFLSGVFGGCIGAGGPPVIVYSTIQPWTKDQGKGTMAFFFLIAGLMISLSHAVSGLITSEVLHYSLISLPALCLGIWLGVTLYKRISDHGYKKMVFVLVFLLGCMMIFQNI